MPLDDESQEEDLVPDNSPVGPVSIINQNEISLLLEDAVLNFAKVSVQLDNHLNPFQTDFVLNEQRDLTAIRQGSHVLVGPLDPPIGNLKIRFAKQVVLHFATEMHVVVLTTVFLGTDQERNLKLGFSPPAILTPQLRSGQRLRVHPDWPVEVILPNAQGMDCIAKIQDISRGGIAVYPLNPAEILEEHRRFRLKILLYPMPPMELVSECIGTKTEEGRTCFRLIFHFRNRHEREAMEFLISQLKTKEKNRRLELFGLQEG